MATSKAWMNQPIVECGEPLVPIPENVIARVHPHPYLSLGAFYADTSPHMLRSGVLQRLLAVQSELDRQQPGYKLQIFDAYRPNAVQQFMVDHSYAQMRAESYPDGTPLSNEQEQSLWEKVYTYWAIPSDDPLAPPGHSTGAAIDLSILNALGQPLDMGTAIDEFSPRAAPDYFADTTATEAQKIHRNRLWLKQLMASQDFVQHPAEWWHFSYGEQIWAWQQNSDVNACYGRADLV